MSSATLAGRLLTKLSTSDGMATPVTERLGAIGAAFLTVALLCFILIHFLKPRLNPIRNPVGSVYLQNRVSLHVGRGFYFGSAICAVLCLVGIVFYYQGSLFPSFMAV